MKRLFSSAGAALLTVQVLSFIGFSIAGLMNANFVMSLNQSWVIEHSAYLLLLTAPELISFNLIVDKMERSSKLQFGTKRFWTNFHLQFFATIVLAFGLSYLDILPDVKENLYWFGLLWFGQLGIAMNPVLLQQGRLIGIHIDGIINFVLPFFFLFDHAELFFGFLAPAVLLKVRSLSKQTEPTQEVSLIWKNAAKITSLKLTALVRSMFTLTVVLAFSESNAISHEYLFLVPLALRSVTALSGLFANINLIRFIRDGNVRGFGRNELLPLFGFATVACTLTLFVSPTLALFLGVLLVEVRHTLFAQKYFEFYFKNHWMVNGVISVGWYVAITYSGVWMLASLLTIDILMVALGTRKIDENQEA